MEKRIPRKLKKIIRNIHLCHSGNPLERKSKYSKYRWVSFTRTYYVWIKATIQYNEVFIEARTANTVKKNNHGKD